METLMKLNPVAQMMIVTILCIFVVTIILSLSLKSKYRRILRDIQSESCKKDEVFSTKVINYIIDDYKKAAQRNVEVNTQAIIEANFNAELGRLQLGEKFINKSTSLMIILGLLGTFFGLTLAIAELVNTLNAAGGTEMLGNMDNVIGGLINSVNGMSVAFVTSLFGIASSIVITILNIFISVDREREAVMIEIEEYLDNTLAKGIVIEERNSDLKLQMELIETLKEFNKSLESTMGDMSETISYRFEVAASGIEQFSSSLMKSVDKFDNSLNTFSENVRDFSEFNHHLKTNIQRMNVSFNDFTEELKTTTKELQPASKQLVANTGSSTSSRVRK